MEHVHFRHSVRQRLAFEANLCNGTTSAGMGLNLTTTDVYIVVIGRPVSDRHLGQNFKHQPCCCHFGIQVAVGTAKFKCRGRRFSRKWGYVTANWEFVSADGNLLCSWDGCMLPWRVSLLKGLAIRLVFLAASSYFWAYRFLRGPISSGHFV